jgi:hypothetical protein
MARATKYAISCIYCTIHLFFNVWQDPVGDRVTSRLELTGRLTAKSFTPRYPWTKKLIDSNPKRRLFLKIDLQRDLAAGVYLSEEPSPPRFLFVGGKAIL